MMTTRPPTQPSTTGSRTTMRMSTTITGTSRSLLPTRSR